MAIVKIRQNLLNKFKKNNDGLKPPEKEVKTDDNQEEGVKTKFQEIVNNVNEVRQKLLANLPNIKTKKAQTSLENNQLENNQVENNQVENQPKKRNVFKKQFSKFRLPFANQNQKITDRDNQTNQSIKLPETLNKSKKNNSLEKIEEKLDNQRLTKVKIIFEKFLDQVKPEDTEKINQNLEKMYRGPIKEIWPKIQSLVKMIRDPQSAWRTKALGIATLVYLISPFDAIPDVIPVVGLADDAALIVAVVSTLAYQLEKYLIKQAENQAEIEIRKYNKIVRITLIGSIITALLTIVVKFILNQL